MASSSDDALAFLEALYGAEPPGRILISAPVNGSWRTHAVMRPPDALPYVIGKTDVFHRVTLVAQRPASGRGTESDTSALTCVWLDIDVNGGPDVHGAKITNAAPTVDAALALVHCVLAPTLIVRSGYGVHAYWLLTEPWLINDDQARAEAKRLVRAWHARHKAEAARFGIPKFDSVFDLARVLRPVGSLNGKGKRPQPVELLHANGPLYPTEMIRAEGRETPDIAAVPVDIDTEPGRPIADLLRTYPRLRRLLKREGVAPGKGSDSDWDWALACEAMRPPRSCVDGEVLALLQHNRSVHPDPKHKGSRDDYLQRTVARAREATGDRAEAARMDPCELVSRRWNLGDDPVDSGEFIGTGLGAVVRLSQRSGRVIRIHPYRVLFDMRAHNREVSVAARTRFKALTGEQAHETAQAVYEICHPQDPDPTEEFAETFNDFVATLGNVLRADMDVVNRWGAMQLRDEAEERLPHRLEPARRTVAIQDEHGRLWLPAAAVRAAARFPLWPDLHSAAVELGYTIERLDLHPPGARQPGQKHTRRTFYVQPKEPDA